jgi:phosphoserine aminotransferase
VDDAYYHICLNNTIAGTKWASLPETGTVPLVADVSSCIASEPLDVSKFGLLYAGAQKNLGPAGCALVIIRNDLIGRAPEWTPTMLNYETHAKEKSLFNTPPCWCIYMIGLVLEWVRECGGLSAMKGRNEKKASLLYNALGESKLFYSPIEEKSRSLMNVVFLVREGNAEKKKEIEARFLKEAGGEGLVNLAGHRLVGGLRASIYNAMPYEGVEKLVSFMKKFEHSL